MKSLLVMLMTANVVCGGYAATSAWGDQDRIGAGLPPLAAPELHLLTERPATVEIREPSEPIGTSLRGCRSWGPFATVDDAQRFGSRLRAPSRLDIVGDTVEASRGFLVYVSVDAVLASNGAIRRALADSGVESQLIASGGLAGALAVGVFAREGSAEAHARNLKSAGVPTHVIPLVDTTAVFHLVVADAAPSAGIDATAEECAPIASTEPFL